MLKLLDSRVYVLSLSSSASRAGELRALMEARRLTGNCLAPKRPLFADTEGFNCVGDAC